MLFVFQKVNQCTNNFLQMTGLASVSNSISSSCMFLTQDSNEFQEVCFRGICMSSIPGQHMPCYLRQLKAVLCETLLGISKTAHRSDPAIL